MTITGLIPLVQSIFIQDSRLKHHAGVLIDRVLWLGRFGLWQNVFVHKIHAGTDQTLSF